MFYILHFLFVLHFLQLTLQISSPNSPYYTAAVVEYYPDSFSNTPEERTLKNVNNYLSLLDGVTEDLDIVVFPEGTVTYGFQTSDRNLTFALATAIPDPSKNIVVCDERTGNYSQYLINLSCGAKNHTTYLVANVIEKHPCTGNKCATDNWDFYNSNVVFDRNGTVVGRYRKYNLFGEYSMNKTNAPELSSFTTDFNVTFGQFICFDLLFDSPANALIRSGVYDFVFPTMWFSELPFLTALQAQKQWAYENNVNFLAAGANNPSVGSGGTAIFEGSRGAVVQDILINPLISNMTIYVANVTKRTSLSSSTSVESKLTTEEIDRAALTLDNFYLKKDTLTDYKFQLINTSTTTNIHKSLCHGSGENSLCCNFHVNITVDNVTNSGTNNSYNYAFLAFSGIRSYSGVYNGGTEVCAIVACSGNTSDTCGLRLSNYSTISWPVTFEGITIEGNFSISLNKTQYPNSLRSNLRPLPTTSIEWSSEKNAQTNSTKRILQLIGPENRLMTFAIYGRDYSRDGEVVFNNNSYSIHTLTYCIFITLFGFIFK